MRPMTTLCLLFMSVTSFWAAAAALGAPAEPPIRYVLAATGLDLRQDASVAAPVLTRMPCGAEVRLLMPAAAAGPAVDNLAGGMARVAYGGETGFAFDGYLSQFPAPDLEGMETGSYVARLRQAGSDILREQITRDWGGYEQQEEALVLPAAAIAEAFLIAKLLYEIPAGIPFPPASDELNSTYQNPGKDPLLWTDELDVERNARGEVIVMRYYARREGGGVTVEIKPSPEPAGIRIARILISD